MPLNRIGVYPDSDFGYSSLSTQLLNIVDLTKVKVYKVNGEAMVKLSDLEELDFVISQDSEEIDCDELKAA